MINQDFFLALEDLEREKGISQVEFITALENALVIIAAASNDFILNFYNIPTRRLTFSVDEYQDYLLLRLQNFIKVN